MSIASSSIGKAAGSESRTTGMRFHQYGDGWGHSRRCNGKSHREWLWQWAVGWQVGQTFQPSPSRTLLAMLLDSHTSWEQKNAKPTVQMKPGMILSMEMWMGTSKYFPTLSVLGSCALHLPVQCSLLLQLTEYPPSSQFFL
jgi:hypothetical protein